LYEVQKLLGHSNPRTTQRYAHLSRDKLAQAAEVMVSFASADKTGD
jgi:site-specific recombinase XerD